MKKTYFVLFGLISLLVMMVIHNFIVPYIESKSESKDTSTKKVVYSEAYTKSLREEAIEELYGSREQYARDHTGSRADYIDKEASKSGELVIDEERMQTVYNQKLQEFDAKVDSEKVDKLVKEKQEQLVESQAYKDMYKVDQNEHYSREMMYWNSGGKYFAMVVDLFMILYLIFFKLKKNK